MAVPDDVLGDVPDAVLDDLDAVLDVPDAVLDDPDAVLDVPDVVLDDLELCAADCAWTRVKASSAAMVAPVVYWLSVALVNAEL